MKKLSCSWFLTFNWTHFSLSIFTFLSTSLLCDQGTPALSGSSIAADLLKGTNTKLATEELSNPEKAREHLAKGHVIYEGKSGHILSYDGNRKLC